MGSLWHADIAITARAKFFAGYGIETRRCLVDEVGVMVYDDIAGYYTRVHSLSRRAERRLRRLARKEAARG